MRLVENPPNPFTAANVDWLGEPPAAKVVVYEEHARQILNENDSPDIPFRYSVNPYRGCQHACAYCYARPTHEYLGFGAGTDFDTKICVKLNAAELLEQRLSKRPLGGDSIAFSGVTDCYQPIEVHYELMRRCIEVCIRHRQPIGIVTKSYLIVRDLELLRGLSAVARLRVYFSVPFANDEISRAIEPHAPPTSRRFLAMRQFADAGIEVGAMIAPLIPGLNDRDIPELVARSAENGARLAAYVPLRLPGHVADVFLERLRARLPLHANRVEQRVRDGRGGRLNDPRFGHRMNGRGQYWAAIHHLFETALARNGIAVNSPSLKPISGDRRPAPTPQVVQLTLFGR